MSDWHIEPHSDQMFFHLVDSGRMPSDLSVINAYPFWVVVGKGELCFSNYDIVEASDIMTWINQKLGAINEETHVAAYPCSTWEQAEGTMRHVETAEERIRTRRLIHKEKQGRIRIRRD